jgi:hypothetical protein
MATIEITGLDRTVQEQEIATNADLAVVRDGEERVVHVLRVPEGWLVTTSNEHGKPEPADTQLNGSFTDAALYGIGLALERPVEFAVTA